MRCDQLAGWNAKRVRNIAKIAQREIGFTVLDGVQIGSTDACHFCKHAFFDFLLFADTFDIVSHNDAQSRPFWLWSWENVVDEVLFVSAHADRLKPSSVNYVNYSGRFANKTNYRRNLDVLLHAT